MLLQNTVLSDKCLLHQLLILLSLYLRRLDKLGLTMSPNVHNLPWDVAECLREIQLQIKLFENLFISKKPIKRIAWANWLCYIILIIVWVWHIIQIHNLNYYYFTFFHFFSGFGTFGCRAFSSKKLFLFYNFFFI